MPERKTIDWKAVQTDRDSGMRVAEICTKYNVSNPAVYARTHGARNGATPKKKKGRGIRRALNGVANGKVHEKPSDPIIVQLTARHDLIDRAIAALQEAEDRG